MAPFNVKRFFFSGQALDTFSIGNNVKSHLKSVPFYGKDLVAILQHKHVLPATFKHYFR